VLVCFRSRVIFQFFHVSFLDLTTCHSLGDPHVVSFFVHVSCAYWSTCHFRVAARGTLWMFHVSFFESYMCRFLLVPRVIFIQLHVVLLSQNHFVIELFTGLVLAGASLIFIIPFQPAGRTAFCHRRNDEAGNYRKGAT